METTKFVKLPNAIPGGHEPLDKLKIEVDYQKGGFSVLTGEYSDNGIYVYITPCSYNNGVTGTFINGELHTMGFKIFLKGFGRKSQKQINIAAERIMPFAEEIAKLYDKKDYHGIHALVVRAYNI